MNWLAHLFLSEASAEFRIGNLLPDILPPDAIRVLPLEFRRGASCHRAIDRFTDAHAKVRQSVQRLRPERRRFGGILVDLFYDHFLANRWSEYSAVGLEEFAIEVYEGFSTCEDQLPASAKLRLHQIRSWNLLCSYRDLSGLSRVLTRIGKRFRRPVDLSPAMMELEQGYDLFYDDFSAFFPTLRQHVKRTMLCEG